MTGSQVVEWLIQVCPSVALTGQVHLSLNVGSLIASGPSRWPDLRAQICQDL